MKFVGLYVYPILRRENHLAEKIIFKYLYINKLYPSLQKNDEP